MSTINIKRATDGFWHAYRDESNQMIGSERSAWAMYREIKVKFPGNAIRVRSIDVGPSAALSFGEWIDLVPG